MKRINCRQTAIEGCATRAGTVVGPLMTELVGFAELTPYKGGWCGNEIFADSFTARIRSHARELTFRFGEQLRKEGYRGYFELDFLIDKKSGQLYLGELNPRVTRASSMTNHAAFAHADLPLFMLHLLEFSGADFEFDVEALNARWSNKDNIDSWSQMVIKHVDDSIDVLAGAPQTGIWKLLPDGSVEYSRFDYHRRAVESEREAFFLRISGPGDFRYKGADLGILITRGRLMTKDFKLNDRAHRWIAGITSQFVGRPLAPLSIASRRPAVRARSLQDPLILWEQGHGDPRSPLQLRPTPPHLRGGAGPDLDLPLPGLPAADGERLRDPGTIFPRPGDPDRGPGYGLHAHRRQRQRDHLPFLPGLRHDGLLGARADARHPRRGHRRLRRSRISGTRRLRLRASPACLGRDQPEAGAFGLGNGIRGDNLAPRLHPPPSP